MHFLPIFKVFFIFSSLCHLQLTAVECKNKLFIDGRPANNLNNISDNHKYWGLTVQGFSMFVLEEIWNLTCTLCWREWTVCIHYHSRGLSSVKSTSATLLSQRSLFSVCLVVVGTLQHHKIRTSCLDHHETKEF